MESLLAALASLVILVPILYFLPIGFSKKGKGIIIIISFIFANVGILANFTYPLWQTSVVLLLLVVLTSIVLSSRFMKALSTTGKAEELETQDEDLQMDEQNEDELIVGDDFISETVSPISEDKKEANIKMVALDEEEISPEDIEMFIDSYEKKEDATYEDAIEELEIVPVTEVKPLDKEQVISVEAEQTLLNIEPTNSPYVEMTDLLEEDLGEEISFLLNRDELLADTSITEAGNGNVDQPFEDLGYMAEIERMLELDDSIEDLPSERIEQEKTIINLQKEQEIEKELENLIDEPAVLHEVAASIENDALEETEIPVLQFEDISKTSHSEPHEKEEVSNEWDDDFIEPIKEFKHN